MMSSVAALTGEALSLLTPISDSGRAKVTPLLSSQQHDLSLFY